MIEQRLWSNNEQDATYFKELIRLAKIHKGSCDRVWFCIPHGFLDLEFHKKHLEALLPIAEELRANDIGVSLQAGFMVKHEAGGLRDCDAHIPVEVNTTGIGCCPRDKNFLKYNAEVVELYARCLKPDTFFPDDDMGIRFVFAGPRCTCASCMKEFNARYGYSYTDESLETAMIEDLDLRNKFLEFAYEGLAIVADTITRAAQKGYPNIKMGLQHGGYNGDSYLRVFDAYAKAGQTEMASRSGAGSYFDREPMELVMKAHLLEFQLSRLPKNVTDRYAEIENYPHVFYGKSTHGVCLESTLYLAQGFNYLSYSAIPRKQEDFEYVDSYFQGLSQYSAYWKTMLSENENTIRSGIQVYVPKEFWNKKEEKWYDFAPEWTFARSRMGLPFTYQKQKGNAYILDEKVVYCLSREEVKYLATQPVLTSARVLKLLEERGFGDLIGATASLYERGIERGIYFTNHSINKMLTVPSFTASPFVEGEYFRLNGNIEPISVYGTFNYLGDNQREYIEKENVADAIVNTTLGGKWAVFGYSAFTDIMSFNRRTQIIKAVAYIGGKIPALIAEKNRMELFPRSDKNEKTKSVTLVNCSIERAKSIELKIENPAGNTFVFMDAEREIKLNAIWDGHCALLKLPPMDGWSVGTVFVRE